LSGRDREIQDPLAYRVVNGAGNDCGQGSAHIFADAAGSIGRVSLMAFVEEALDDRIVVHRAQPIGDVIVIEPTPVRGKQIFFFRNILPSAIIAPPYCCPCAPFGLKT